MLATKDVAKLAGFGIERRQIIFEQNTLPEQPRGEAGKKIFNLRPKAISLGLVTGYQIHRHVSL